MGENCGLPTVEQVPLHGGVLFQYGQVLLGRGIGALPVLVHKEGAAGEEHVEWGALKSAIRSAVKNYLYNQTKRNPVILPIIVEVDSGGKKS